MKTLEWWGSRGYIYKPKVSFLVENHNMSSETIDVVRGIREYPNSEIIVMDDGSCLASTDNLLAELGGVNEYVLHFNDLFGTLTINKALRFANGELVVKMQDDDLYPGTKWIEDGVALFEKYPDMVILGGRGQMTLPVDHDFSKAVPWEPYPDEFKFVQAVNEAPMWYRRFDVMRLGGYDEEFAPFMWSEQELCYRAWLAGKSVGWYPNDSERCAIKTPERRLNKRTLQHETWKKNAEIFERNFASKLGLINDIVRSRNEGLHYNSPNAGAV